MSTEEHLLCFISCVPTCTYAEYPHYALVQIVLLPGQSCLSALQGKAGLASSVQGSSSWWAPHRAISLLGWVHGTGSRQGTQPLKKVSKQKLYKFWCGGALCCSLAEPFV